MKTRDEVEAMLAEEEEKRADWLARGNEASHPVGEWRVGRIDMLRWVLGLEELSVEEHRLWLEEAAARTDERHRALGYDMSLPAWQRGAVWQ